MEYVGLWFDVLLVVFDLMVIVEWVVVDLFIDCEWDVFLVIGYGLINVEIVQWLFVGEFMVKMYVGWVLVKFGVCDCIYVVIVVYWFGFVGDQF